MQELKEFVRELFSPIIREAVQEQMAGVVAEFSPGRETSHSEHLRHREYLNSKEVQMLFGLNPKTLAAWRSQGRGPSYTQNGAVVLYRRADVEAWLKSGKKRTADQPGLK